MAETEEKTTSFLSPEAILMMSAVIVMDIGELFIDLEPIDPLDIVSFLFFGSWMWLRSGGMGRIGKKPTAGVSKTIKWARRMKWLRPLCFILEFIPIIGNFPFWALVVYQELKRS